MTPETKDHLWQQFDKIFVGLFLLFAFWLLTHNLRYYNGDDSVINQTWGVVTFFLGLLSGLITGSAKTRADDKNGGTDEKANANSATGTNAGSGSVPTN